MCLTATLTGNQSCSPGWRTRMRRTSRARWYPSSLLVFSSMSDRAKATNSSVSILLCIWYCECIYSTHYLFYLVVCRPSIFVLTEVMQARDQLQSSWNDRRVHSSTWWAIGMILIKNNKDQYLQCTYPRILVTWNVGNQWLGGLSGYVGDRVGETFHIYTDLVNKISVKNENRNLLMKLKLFCRSVGGLLEVDDRMKFTQYVLSTAGNNKTALPTLQVRVICLNSFSTM